MAKDDKVTCPRCGGQPTEWDASDPYCTGYSDKSLGLPSREMDFAPDKRAAYREGWNAKPITHFCDACKSASNHGGKCDKCGADLRKIQF